MIPANRTGRSRPLPFHAFPPSFPSRLLSLLWLSPFSPSLPVKSLHMPTPLVEHLHDWHSASLRVDRDARMVYDVALTAVESANGYRYLPEALERAVPLYERKPVFLDHAPAAHRPRDRSMRDLVGTIRAARYVEGRIRGDIEVVDTEAGRIFLGLVETQSPALGMSHVVLAQQDPAAKTITAIVDVISVDAVAFPATAATFAEQSESAIPPESTTPNVTCHANPSCTNSCAACQPQISELTQLQQENAELRQQLQALQESQRELLQTQQVQTLLEAAQLPPDLLTHEFRQLLEKTPPGLRPALIEERITLARQWRPTPHSLSRTSHTSANPTDASIIETIRKRFSR
jgi:cytochrome c553